MMKKILAIALLAFSLSAGAFWGNNWGNNMPWGGQQDNGIFGFNPYDYWDPSWYSQEMDNMIDEFDDNNYGNNYGNRYGNNYGNNYGNRYGNNYGNRFNRRY
ncbi:MAG: hypothetical protein HAW58_04250 [Candidatus Thioglobus sp.]|nr:hypothetical protein [Candidatus Thioglobus sp.]